MCGRPAISDCLQLALPSLQTHLTRWHKDGLEGLPEPSAFMHFSQALHPPAMQASRRMHRVAPAVCRHTVQAPLNLSSWPQPWLTAGDL